MLMKIRLSTMGKVRISTYGSLCVSFIVGIVSFILISATNIVSEAMTKDNCEVLFDDIIHSISYEGEKSTSADDANNPENGITYTIHRNGEADPCGSTSLRLSDMKAAFKSGVGNYKCSKPNRINKYDIESFLTQLFIQHLTATACGSTDNSTAPQGLVGYCDMGPERTPTLPDHKRLVRVHGSTSNDGGILPCRFFTREGVRISSLQQLSDIMRGSSSSQSSLSAGSCSSSANGLRESNDDDANKTCSAPDGNIHLYAVPAGRVFMFAPSHIGEIFHLSHIKADNQLPVSLEVLSLNPRVFDVINFFSKEESDQLVRKALAETSDVYGFHRSTTGTAGNDVFSKRTSENAWDTHGPTARKIKRRCMETLGFDAYIEGFTDGLQILRYNKSNAYTAHSDYFADNIKKEIHDYDSAGRGSNRFATILLYMSDLGENDGGETVFTEAWLPEGRDEGNRDLYVNEAREGIRGSGILENTNIKIGSWEEQMIVQCKTRLAIRPSSARAVLFYSQHPNGKQDMASKHGACPVLNGTKWAANLWVWNGLRKGIRGEPKNQKFDEHYLVASAHTGEGDGAMTAEFQNSGTDPKFAGAQLFYESSFWGKLGYNDPPLRVTTYEGHRWYVKSQDGHVIKEIIIPMKRAEKNHHEFVL